MPDSAPRPLQVLPLGIGDAFSSLDYYTSMLILGGKTVCQIDCPDPIHKILRERTACLGEGTVSAANLDHILLTHLHGDHCGGLESLLFYRKFVLRMPPPTIHTIAEVAESLWTEKLAPAMRRTEAPEIGIDSTFTAEDYFRIRIVRPGEPFDLGDLRFEIRRTIHVLPTFGFRVALANPQSPIVPPRSFGYSCDTAFDPAHIAFLAKADLVFHECGKSEIHTPYSKLQTLDPAVRAKIHILHLADDFPREDSEFPIVQPGRLYTV